MSKEALRLALEALETVTADVKTTPTAYEAQRQAITALREALAEHPAQGCEYCNNALYAGTKCKNCGRVTEQAAIKQDLTPEQPAQQEPVAWRNAALRVGEDLCSVGPFGYYDMTAEQWLDWALSVVTVHTPPAQRKPLTDEEIILIVADCASSHQHTDIHFARAIERAHGIKELV